MAELTSMTNMGKEMARKLASVGIDERKRELKNFCDFFKK